MLEVAGGVAVAYTEQFIFFVFIDNITVKVSFTLLGDDFRDAGTAGFKIVDNIFCLVNLLSVFKYRVAHPSAERVALAVGSEGTVGVIDGNFIGFQLDGSVDDLGSSIQPDHLSVNAAMDRVTCRVVDGGFDVSLFRWYAVGRVFDRIGGNCCGRGSGGWLVLRPQCPDENKKQYEKRENKSHEYGVDRLQFSF